MLLDNAAHSANANSLTKARLHPDLNVIVLRPEHARNALFPMLRLLPPIDTVLSPLSYAKVLVPIDLREFGRSTPDRLLQLLNA